MSMGAFALMLVTATGAEAATARVRWLPSSGTVVGYDVFVRQSGQPYGAGVDAGLPTPGAGGVLSYDLDSLADGVIYYFTVTARGSNGTRSACAGELVLGNPGLCVIDSCCPGGPCTNDSVPDGTPCDPTNACRLCRAAACATAAESALDTLRLKVAGRSGTPRVNVSGTFVPPGAFTPAGEGLTLSFFDADGTVLRTVSVPPEAIRANPGGTAFVLARDYPSGTLRTMTVRLREGVARVRARLLADPGTPTGPLGWAVASGATCGRSAPLACSATTRGFSCR
jgi:hypothetical protein